MNFHPQEMVRLIDGKEAFSIRLFSLNHNHTHFSTYEYFCFY